MSDFRFFDYVVIIQWCFGLNSGYLIFHTFLVSGWHRQCVRVRLTFTSWIFEIFTFIRYFIFLREYYTESGRWARCEMPTKNFTPPNFIQFSKCQIMHAWYIEVNLLERFLNGIKCKSHVFGKNDPKTVINNLQVASNGFSLAKTEGLRIP